MEERAYYLGFSVSPGIGPKRLRDLLQYFGTARLAWNSERSDLLPLIGNVYTEKFLRFRTAFSTERYYKFLKQQDIWFVASCEEQYPQPLLDLPNPPIVLFGKGERSALSVLATTFSVGVVGTRRITTYGRQVTEMITNELVDAKCIIVSGLAMGVDAVAHSITIQNNGTTVAVLGSGVDVCHPAANRLLYEHIITSSGAVVSEYPPGEPPSKGSFPSRNRIIAGLSQAVIVTEGSADSGALYTASDAFQLGRPVFAVPGPITSSLSDGPNSLLTKGATLVTSGRDILNALGIKNFGVKKQKSAPVCETEEEQLIVTYLQNEPLLFDEIIKLTNFEPGKLSILLSLMEMKGFVRQSEGVYSLTS